MLYKNLPRNVGLRRLTLHKSATGPNVNYILLVECSHFLDNINQVRESRGSFWLNESQSPSGENLSRAINLHLSGSDLLAALSALSQDSLSSL